MLSTDSKINQKVHSPSAHPTSSTDPTGPQMRCGRVSGALSPRRTCLALGSPVPVTPLAWVSCELGLFPKLEGRWCFLGWHFGLCHLRFQPAKLLETKSLDKGTFHLLDGSFRDLGPNAVHLGLFMWFLTVATWHLIRGGPWPRTWRPRGPPWGDCSQTEASGSPRMPRLVLDT